MKKLFITIFILSLFTSCKKELPENIKSALISYEDNVKYRTTIDSIILNTPKKEIDKLSLDSIKSIIRDYELKERLLESSKSELDELLKYNPEYSDYEEVKNMKKPYFYKDMAKFAENLFYIQDRQNKLYLESLK